MTALRLRGRLADREFHQHVRDDIDWNPRKATGHELPLPDGLDGLFIEPERYVSAPLEATYDLTWNDCPAPYRDAVLDDAADAGRTPD